jgi:hypothetical protein
MPEDKQSWENLQRFIFIFPGALINHNLRQETLYASTTLIYKEFLPPCKIVGEDMV